MSGHFKDQLQARVHEAIQAMFVRGLSDPRLDHVMLTITRVVLADDMRNATVYLSIYPAKAHKRAIAAIRHAETHIRRHVANVLALHTPPVLSFDVDVSGTKQAEVLDALAKVSRERMDREERENAGKMGEGPDAADKDDPSSPGAPERLAPRPNVWNASKPTKGASGT